MTKPLYKELKEKIMLGTLTQEDIDAAKRQNFDFNFKYDGGFGLLDFEPDYRHVGELVLLAKNGVDIRPCCKMAAVYGQANVLISLVDQGVISANVRLARGDTLCMWLAYFGHTDAIKSFKKECDADLDIQSDDEGWTACMCAASGNKIDTVKELVKLGARIDIKNDQGKTVLDYIEHEDAKKEIIALRKEYEKAHPEAVSKPAEPVRPVGSKNGSDARLEGIDKSTRDGHPRASS